jgi:hypothetical protein
VKPALELNLPQLQAKQFFSNVRSCFPELAGSHESIQRFDHLRSGREVELHCLDGVSGSSHGSKWILTRI